MNDPQEKNTKNPYHINYKNYLDTNAQITIKVEQTP